ncbi:MAG: ornithine cyclodeaminase family protein [Proteobacteria bacterium]|nr:ornithine cyclodeaminase family protein [Pseudomonadota bacterium]MBI3498526.1 ornithine cyclodeaminase family protein [Pseudomonadota bacterium]
MRSIAAAEVERVLDFPSLVDRLQRMFQEGCEVPPRHHHAIDVPDAAKAMLLLMPAWQVGRHIGIKLVTVFPDNAGRSLPSVMGTYFLLDGKTGRPEALIDGPMLTLRRTAAASALAARFLAREDAKSMLMVGTGALAPHLIEAHASVRAIREVTVWGRDFAKAEALARRLSRPGLAVGAAADLAAAVGAADVISCATLSKTPLIRGAWLKPGQHLDLVGAYTPEMREADDAAVSRSTVWVDTKAGALKEAGDVVQPIRSGVLAETAIAGDLFGLCRGEAKKRSRPEEITFFKSVGTALEDLAAAELVAERVAA